MPCRRGHDGYSYTHEQVVTHARVSVASQKLLGISSVIPYLRFEANLVTMAKLNRSAHAGTRSASFVAPLTPEMRV